MSLFSRIMNLARGRRLEQEIDEELASHIAEAIERGRDPGEARRAFGSMLKHREESFDLKVVAWLNSLRADAIFGWRQLMKSKIASGVAIVSLALAVGACTSAFRLIDALLLRPLPVSGADRLYALARLGADTQGQQKSYDSCEYPFFRQIRALAKDEAELVAVSYAIRSDVTFGADQDMEKAYTQYVSGWMFSAFGLRPSVGRLLTENDDREPRAHPYAVLSHDYWTRRFGKDPKVVGRTLRVYNDLYEIVGVGPEGFTGTEPGTVNDIFVPTLMHRGVLRDDWSWFRALVHLKTGVAVEPLRDKLQAALRAFLEHRAKGYPAMPKEAMQRFLNQRLIFAPAAAGVSQMQKENRLSLAALAVLVGLVLLIACANVANLMTAQAASRARELALRVSIGAGRWRLVQMVLIESALLALLATALGSLFAWWSAPVVVSMINPPDNPARLYLPADWRVFGFSLALSLGVTLLFGLAPALRASAVRPVSALKGGDDPHSRRRLMHAMVVVQVAFCFLVHFVAGLFVTTFNRLTNLPTGFSAERVLTLDAFAAGEQPVAFWEQAMQDLRAISGVQNVALAGWPLLSGNSWNGFIAVGGARPTADLAEFLNVSPGWFDAMKIPLITGRDFRESDTQPGAAVVSQSFAQRYFNGESPLGKTFDIAGDDGHNSRFEVIGVVGDVRHLGPRVPIRPTAYVPFRSVDGKGVPRRIDSGTFIVRTAGDPLALASVLRREVPHGRPGFRVSNILTQQELNQSHMVREQLLATLAIFFAVVALLLAVLGLSGVLHYSVLQRRREIGIRLAIGAQTGDITRRVTGDVFGVVLLGALGGLVLGMTSVRYIESLLFQVKATDWGMLVIPWLTVLTAASIAAVPAILQAVRIDPVKILRTE